MSLAGYVDTQRLNFEAIKDSPHYSCLIETVDHLYRTALELGSAHCPRLCFGKMLLMCHKSLLSSATLIARGQPDDAALVSRRAIEIGHLAIAVHLDSQNYVRWLDKQRRTAQMGGAKEGTAPEVRAWPQMEQGRLGASASYGATDVSRHDLRFRRAFHPRV